MKPLLPPSPECEQIDTELGLEGQHRDLNDSLKTSADYLCDQVNRYIESFITPSYHELCQRMQ